jgi:Zn-dependent M28 family amino/carboxypeptidase
VKVRIGLLMLGCFALIAMAGQGAASRAGAVAADGIRRHTVVLGSDALEGRAPGTLGGARAASYIAAELRRLGIKPLGDEGYEQEVPLIASKPLSGSRLELGSHGLTIPLELGRDYLLYTSGAQTWLPKPVPMVFVGYGIVAPELDYNDYASVDVRGKIVVYVGGEPASEDEDYFAGEALSVYAQPETKQRIALSRGALGSVLLPLPAAAATEGWSELVSEFAFEDLSLAYSVPRHLSLVIHPRHAATLFDGALYDHADVEEMLRTHTVRSFYLRTSLRFEGEFRTRSFLAPNIVGVIEGSHPRLSETSVVVSAHYDHLGVGPPVNGDSIYNGVVDNALGVACVLELAQVLSRDPPRRSVIILLTTAEEKGLLGAHYFLDHPPVPLVKLVADVNVDGLAFRACVDDLIGIGGELSSLGQTLKRSVEPMSLAVMPCPRSLGGDEAFARSDQIAFAERGVPAILINEGLHWQGFSEEEAILETMAWLDERYHSPQDDLAQPLDFGAAAQHCSAVAAFVRQVADDAIAPEWRPGVEYAYTRLLSLAEDGR